MLSPDRIITFLTHPDRWVRDHALDYLTDAHDPSSATDEDLWRAIDALPPDARRPYYRSLPELPQTEASLRRLLDAAREMRDEENRSLLLSAVRHIEFPFLQVHIDEIRSLPNLPKDLIAHIDTRLALSRQPPEQVWEALKAHSDEQAGAYVGENDPNIAWRMIEALARHPDFAGPRALETISQPSDGSWLGIWAVDLAGVLRLSAAVEPLVKHLEEEEDADYFTEQVSKALTKLGSPEVVARIADLMTRASWGPKVSAADLLGNIKLPESESLLLKLLRSESDGALLAFLGHSLASLCPTEPEKLDVLRSLIVQNRFDRSTADLVRDIVSVATMVDWRPPEFDGWRQETAREEKRIRRLLDDPHTMDDLMNRMARAQFEAEKPAKIPAPPEFVPFRRETPKVGRNDPCPCGSGKKYKKCCGRE